MTDRIALAVGIDDYAHAPLKGCVADVIRLNSMLESNHDGSPNFHVETLMSAADRVTRSLLLSKAKRLFERRVGVALFYFSGHGTATNLDGYLVTQDAAKYEEGVAMRDILKLANDSPANERVIILDCCHAGVLGNLPGLDNLSVLAEGVSVMAACRDDEVSMESNGGGIFTTLLVEGLNGGAADVSGKVTAASLYAFAEEVLSGWEQRPMFKAHVRNMATLRTCKPSVPLANLRKLTSLFVDRDSPIPLSPKFEPSCDEAESVQTETFKILQQLNRARLVEPVSCEHMYDAAMQSKDCRLTALGRFYWKRVDQRKI